MFVLSCLFFKFVFSGRILTYRLELFLIDKELNMRKFILLIKSVFTMRLVVRRILPKELIDILKT